MNEKKIAQDIENNIWEAIKDVSNSDSYEWEVTFSSKNKIITLNNGDLN